MKVRINRPLFANGRQYHPGEVVDLDGPNLGKLLDQRVLTAVPPDEEKPKARKPA